MGGIEWMSRIRNSYRILYVPQEAPDFMISLIDVRFIVWTIFRRLQ
jgi:hypothetical protein